MISVTILVKNGERRIEQVLDSLKFFNEIILYDTGSSDKTLEIASSYPNVVIHQGSFEGFGRAHNQMADLAKHDWILSIDADEVLSKALSQEILATSLDPTTVYALPFHNFFNGKRIRGCGWGREEHIRLYHRQKTRFSEVKVHEGVIKKELKLHRFKHPLYHYSYETISDFLVKMERYTTLFADGSTARSSPLKAFFRGIWAFFKSYVLKLGFRDGYEGYLISAYNGQTTFYKYLKLYEKNRCS